MKISQREARRLKKRVAELERHRAAVIARIQFSLPAHNHGIKS